MARGRRPNPVTPDASAAAKLGAAIRAARLEEGLTLEALGWKIGFTPQHISSAERAKSTLSKRFVAAADEALHADGHLLRLLEAAVIEQAFARIDRAYARAEAATVDDDVRRRAFLGLGFAAVLFGPDAAARGLSEAEAEHVAYVWSREIQTAPNARALLPGLTADLKRLATNPRVAAQLASYVAAIAVSSGDPGLAKRWWRRARSAAAASGDSHLMAFVAARQAIQGVHGIYSPAQIVVLANDALGATSAPCCGRMHALSAHAQGLALLGRTKAARRALGAVETEFERLPRDVTRDHVSALGWPEDRLHFAASFVGACDGKPHDDAARLYSPAVWRGHAQVRLHRAAAEAEASFAVEALLDLDDAQRADRFVRSTARRVVDACEARGAGATELREVLG